MENYLWLKHKVLKSEPNKKLVKYMDDKTITFMGLAEKNDKLIKIDVLIDLIKEDTDSAFKLIYVHYPTLLKKPEVYNAFKKCGWEQFIATALPHKSWLPKYIL